MSLRPACHGFIEIWGFAGVLFVVGKLFGQSCKSIPLLRASAISWWPPLCFFVPSWAIQRLATGSWFELATGFWGSVSALLDILGFFAVFVGLYMQVYAVAKVFRVSTGKALVMMVLSIGIWFVTVCFLYAALVLGPASLLTFK